MRAGHQGETRPGLRAANYRTRDIRARVAPRRNFDESGNGLPGDFDKTSKAQTCESMDKNRIEGARAGRVGNLPRSP